MIDEIRITNINDWPTVAIESLHEELVTQVPDGATVNTHRKRHIKVVIHEDWPNLKRENLKHTIVKTLDKAQTDHGLQARVESIETVKTDYPAEFE